MYFQTSEYKRRHSLDLVDNNNQAICPTYSKNSIWMKHVRPSNLLYAYITRIITNHILIGKYRLRFFSKESFGCLCGNYPIKTRVHILHRYVYYKKYWNPKRESLNNIITFLEFNLGVFCF